MKYRSERPIKIKKIFNIRDENIEDIYDIIKGSFLPRNTIVIKEFSFIFDIKFNEKEISVISYIF